MLKTYKLLPILLVICFTAAACNKGPKVIESKPKVEQASTIGNSMIDWSKGVRNNPSTGSFSEDVHKVVVKESLEATRYVYLRVEEEGKEFWIATRKQPVSLNQTYYYKGGLLKTNFHSKEFNKTFDQIFLVTKLVGMNHGHHTHNPSETQAQAGPLQGSYKKVDIDMHGKDGADFKANEAAIRISDLVKNPKKFEGKEIHLSGMCVKVNPNIMGRNWIHLKDGTADEYDLVITSTQNIPEGKQVNMKGVVVLNKDFGAGYTYKLILEEGVVL